MSNPKSIVVQPAGAGFQIIIPAEALRMKEAALEKGGRLLKVADAASQAYAIEAAAVIKGLLAKTELDRKEIKQPFWDAGKAIDERAKEYAKELDAEAKRLEKLVADFQRAEFEKAEALKRDAERKARDAEAAAQRERDRLAQIERQKAEAERKALEAKTKKAREAATAEAARLEQERQAAEIDAMEAEDDAAAANATTVAPEPPAATGATVTFVREFEVTDIDAFCEWDLKRRKVIAERCGKPLSVVPAWVRMEVKKSEVKDFISILDENQLDSVPGIKVQQVAKAAVRGVAPALTFQ